ncbi:hypothetical protein PVAP13_8KG034851 [Panicum virgatum]|uniref:Uncharacterized protein n=1 Tax=Panicum virgatum TaxID=38727 RepID=A0A8T0PIF9_PANVG|nr:hypothetical protein PVAP13_8KG034851 [Panicum virgatum]
MASAGPMSVCTATHGRGGGAPAVRWAFARRAQCHRGFAGTASFSAAEGSMSERPRPWSPSSRRRVRWLLLPRAGRAMEIDGGAGRGHGNDCLLSNIRLTTGIRDLDTKLN